MKAAKIQNSLRDLKNDITNCERHLSRVMKDKDNQQRFGRPRTSPLSRTVTTPRFGAGPPPARGTSTGRQAASTQRNSMPSTVIRPSRYPTKPATVTSRNIVCKEVVGDSRGPTRVEVVVRTKPLKRRSRSANASRGDFDQLGSVDTTKYSHKIKDGCNTHSSKGTPSWGCILQQQSASARSNDQKTHRKLLKHGEHSVQQQHGSPFENLSSNELDRWVKSIPSKVATSSHKSLLRINNENARISDAPDGYFSSFNPVRTLNFLIKELRGKIQKNDDDNMQRIVEDMEKAVNRIPVDGGSSHEKEEAPAHGSVSQATLQSPTAGKLRSSNVDAVINSIPTKLSTRKTAQVDTSGAKNLVENIFSTVARMTSATTPILLEEGHVQETNTKKKHAQEYSLLANAATLALKAQLESGCKQLEETCRQMEETCESLRRQRDQLTEEVKTKTHQLETALSKNQQLTVYAADIREEMVRLQQSTEAALQEHTKLEKKRQDQVSELQESNRSLNLRVEETVQENERLSTELQLCRLEKDKLYILMANKDLEVAKLKKEIVDINSLVIEQLAGLRSVAGQNNAVSKIDDMLQAIEKFSETTDDNISSVLTEHERQHQAPFKATTRSNVYDVGESSKPRPVCSSPTSSVNSSLYSSWQLMSDITATDEILPKSSLKGNGDGDASGKPLDKDKDSGIATHSALDLLVGGRMSANHSRNGNTPPMSVMTSKLEHQQLSPAELKAGLQNMFHTIKKQSSEAVNVTLPSPPRDYTRTVELLGVSQWTELSASESTIMLHSSDGFQSD